MDNLTQITTHEYTRLREVERTWEAIFETLKRHKDDCFSQPYTTGRECAVREIERLQQIEKLVDHIEVMR
jgi:hypothetical protein